MTCVPSLRASGVGCDLAQRVADRLGLPFVPVLAKARETAPQKEMSNSAQQSANVGGAFSINGAVPSGPVLLIDDVVDSGWTLTVVADVLRDGGSGPVHPMLLAQSTSD